MSFVYGYIAGIVTMIVSLAVGVLIGKAKQSYDHFKRS